MASIADIEAEARALVDADSTSYPAAALLRRENDAIEEIAGIIIGADGLWQFDDSNFTNFPEAKTTMVAAQNDYSFNVTMLEVLRVSCLDSAGNEYYLTQIDPSREEIPFSELFVSSGAPLYYDIQGSSVLLYPAPAAANVTLTDGLKVYFQRTADLFTSAQVTTGTKVPGFASPFHYLISYMAALPYAQSYKKDRVPMLVEYIERKKKLLIQHYSRRERDRVKRVGMAGINPH